MDQPVDDAGADAGGEDADAYDRLRRRVMWSMPSGLYVLTATSADRDHAMTLSWATQVAGAPRKLIGVGVNRNAVMHQVLLAGGVFCLHLLSRDDKALVRRFVKPPVVDLDAMTIGGQVFRRGKSGSPLLLAAAAFLDCEIVQVVELGDHSLFVGEVVDADFQLPEDTTVLRMEDTRMNYGG